MSSKTDFADSHLNSAAREKADQNYQSILPIDPDDSDVEVQQPFPKRDHKTLKLDVCAGSISSYLFSKTLSSLFFYGNLP